MPDPNRPNNGSGNNFLAFIVGGLVVAVAVLAWLLYGGGAGGDDDVTISIDGAGEAGQAIDEAVTGEN